ncbi:MAG: threonine-phosphate decarboxylase [Nitrospirae bacterium]|nr:threonine-phosphate decarboxylase [Nitrospirota bacterium]
MKKEISIDCHAFEHGGNIYYLANALNMQERKIIDFSSSVNPLGVSKKVKAEIRKNLKYLHNYPDTETDRLRKRIAQYYGISFENILCGNGSTELIYLIVKVLKPQRVLIMAPTFSEYERAVTITESQERRAEIEFYFLKEEKRFEIEPEEFIAEMERREGKIDMVFLCNPNNPTGKLISKDDVIKIADAARENRCYLIVDEAFIDFIPDNSIISETISNPYLIVLRSMSFFYALPGLRIGYGIFPSGLIGSLKRAKQPWTVNSLAQRAAVISLKDKVYMKETLRLIKDEKKFFEKNFKKLKIEYFESDANFYLLRFKNAPEIYKRLLKKGILLRDCSNFRGLDSTYLRVAVKNHRENTILIKEIAKILCPELQSGNNMNNLP